MKIDISFAYDVLDDERHHQHQCDESDGNRDTDALGGFERQRGHARTVLFGPHVIG
jgi:hypothetical protein